MADPEVPEGEVSETPDVIEDNKSANTIASMLWVWKWVNRERLQYETNEDSLFIEFPGGEVGKKFMGGFLETSGETISNEIRTYRYYYVNQFGRTMADDPDYNIDGRYDDPPLFSCPKEESKTKIYEHQTELQEKLNAKHQDYYTEGGAVSEGGAPTTISVEVDFERVNQKRISTESPIKNFGKEDACWIKSEPTQYYLRFGALLRYIKTDIIPKTDTDDTEHEKKPPMFKVNHQPYKNFMYVLPNSISLDPKVCIVRNDAFRKTSGDAVVFQNLQPFRAKDYNVNNPNKAYTMNIYLNFNFIIESLNSNADERGDISVFEFLKAICDGINKSLGGVNNLEPIINERSNTLEIIDTTPIPGINTVDGKYTLQLYGYDKVGNGYTSNFVRKVDLKTAITPEYATMITVGATAGGYVKGTEATAFSRWNDGLTDRFKEKFLPANANSLSGEDGEDEALTNYTNQFLSPNKFISCYGFIGSLSEGEVPTIENLKLSEDAISSNLSVVAEYYKWLISSQKNQQGGTVGFIPFKLSFTMDGLSGIKIYNKLHVDTRFLPKAYGKSVDLIVTGVSHRLQNNDWETDIEATVMPKTNEIAAVAISPKVINNTINLGQNQEEVIAGGINQLNAYGITSTPLLRNAVRDQSFYAFQKLSAKGKVGERPGLCAGFSFNIAYKLKAHIESKSTKAIPWTYTGSGDANVQAHRDAIVGLGIYEKKYLGQFTGAQLKASTSLINTTQWNYGDILNYYSPSNSGPHNMHSQIYTGDIWKKGINGDGKKNATGNSGWTTSGATNYGAQFVYGSSSMMFKVFAFQIKKEYLI
jgi:hypothetical protein